MKRKNNTIILQNPSHYKKIPSLYYFRRWINLVLANQKKKSEITIRIVNEKESAILNKNYRHKLGPTNILSFPFDAPADIDLPYLGDLIICEPVIAKEAKEQNKLLLAHWAHMVIHGTLHLLGYDHIKNEEALVMEKKEINLLSKLGYPNPYIEI